MGVQIKVPHPNIVASGMDNVLGSAPPPHTPTPRPTSLNSQPKTLNPHLSPLPPPTPRKPFVLNFLGYFSAIAVLPRLLAPSLLPPQKLFHSFLDALTPPAKPTQLNIRERVAFLHHLAVSRLALTPPRTLPGGKQRKGVQIPVLS